MTIGRARVAAVLMLIGLGGGERPAPASAQDVPAARAELGADTIRVGDAVPVVVRVPMEPGQRVVWPDTLPLAGPDAENASTVRARVDTLPGGRLEATAVYSVTPWRTGELALPAVSVGRTDGREVVTRTTIPLPSLVVASVLPDSGDAEMKPAKGVVGPSWAWTSILLAVLTALALLAALVWLVRRRSPRDIERPAVDPRARALARLEAALGEGFLDQGAMKPFYTQVSHAVRGYLADLDRAWGDDLTTTELLSRFREQVGTGETTALAGLLRPADQVKFARRRPDVATARSEWEQARDFVQRFTWPLPLGNREEAA